MLFNSIIYGPITSRRLGNSLGVNILPTNKKICSFNCIYCECGWNNPTSNSTPLPNKSQIKEALENTLSDPQKREKLDTITFSGNGEPTLHKDFLQIIKNTVELRNKYCPTVKISVLSNSTQLFRQDVIDALLLCDNRILKLDSAITSTMHLIDQPTNPTLTVEDITKGIATFKGDFTLQICFLQGTCNGHIVDNTTEKEISALYQTIEKLHPKQIMMYGIDRKTPCESIEKIKKDKLEKIAAPLLNKKFNVTIYG